MRRRLVMYVIDRQDWFHSLLSCRSQGSVISTTRIKRMEKAGLKVQEWRKTRGAETPLEKKTPQNKQPNLNVEECSEAKGKWECAVYKDVCLLEHESLHVLQLELDYGHYTSSFWNRGEIFISLTCDALCQGKINSFLFHVKAAKSVLHLFIPW